MRKDREKLERLWKMGRERRWGGKNIFHRCFCFGQILYLLMRVDPGFEHKWPSRSSKVWMVWTWCFFWPENIDYLCSETLLLYCGCAAVQWANNKSMAHLLKALSGFESASLGLSVNPLGAFINTRTTRASNLILNTNSRVFNPHTPCLVYRALSSFF